MFCANLELQTGGGVALLYATKELDKIITANEDEKIGVQIIKNALKAPLMTIAANAGIDGGVVIGKLIEQDNLNMGYDAARGLCCLAMFWHYWL
jgi:chaperonin GroEL